MVNMTGDLHNEGELGKLIAAMEAIPQPEATQAEVSLDESLGESRFAVEGLSIRLGKKAFAKFQLYVAMRVVLRMF